MPNRQLVSRNSAFLVVAFSATMLWGYASGDMQKLFSNRTPAQKAAAEQRAFGHLFGSDQAFDPTAENVLADAEGKSDTISWKLLSHASLRIAKGGTIPEGVDFAGDVQAHDGRQVTITGYMFPLQASGDQSHFLLSAKPPSCPYCMPGGPTELIEITDSDPLAFTYQPITIRGMLHLLGADALQEGMFYRMTQITLVRG